MATNRPDTLDPALLRPGRALESSRVVALIACSLGIDLATKGAEYGSLGHVMSCAFTLTDPMILQIYHR